MIRVVLGVIRITSEWKHMATMPFGVLFILIIASKSWIHYLAAFPQMNGQDHWFPPNQSEYSLFAAFIFQQSGLALVGSQVLVCLVPCLDSLGLSPTIFEETLLQLCITMLQ